MEPIPNSPTVSVDVKQHLKKKKKKEEEVEEEQEQEGGGGREEEANRLHYVTQSIIVQMDRLLIPLPPSPHYPLHPPPII